jgi:MtN3 and saliva related transmembrane protein
MNGMTSADMVGYAATVVGTSMMLPQLARSWRTRQMRDVAWGMISLFLLNCLLWLAYGLLIAARPMVVANGIGFLISLALLGLKIRFRRN